MQNFDKKVKYLNSLFIYKFKIYDYDSKKLKIYYISPDNQHIYFIVDRVPDSTMMYSCEIGELYLDDQKKTTFEDIPSELFSLSKNEFSIFMGIYDKIPLWNKKKIKEIVEMDGKKDLSL